MNAAARSFGPACFLLLGFFVLMRLALPFFPSETWSPSGYLCAGYYLALPAKEPQGCVAREAFGEIARQVHRLDYLSLRSEKFTLDTRGYRNPPLKGLKPRVILAGSSFSLGLSLNDDETLSTQLNQRLGPVVYNSANVLTGGLSAGPMIRSARETGVGQGWVLLEILNRSPYVYNAQGADSDTGYAATILRTTALLQGVRRRIVNPYALVRVTTMINMRLENNVVLPNPDLGRFPEEVLRNGSRMLFFAEDRNFSLHPAGMDTTVASIVRLKGDLSNAGLRLAAILVPTGYTVYSPLIRDAPSGDEGALYMARLSQRLSGEGIPVLNCLPLLRQAALQAFVRGGLVYWPDDAHWNASGVAAVADGIAPWLSGLLAHAF
jgi:hypothetical protein